MVDGEQKHNFVPANKKKLLRPQSPRSANKKTLVLDLDETLVHSSFKPPQDPSLVLNVEIDGRSLSVFVLVRPGVAEFLTEMAKHYELIIYTASLSKYADPLMDILDTNKVCSDRLFREHCTFYEEKYYVKDLSELNRPMTDVIIIDNSPIAYLFQPENALPILSWYEELNDTKLFDYIPFLIQMSKVDDVRPVLT